MCNQFDCRRWHRQLVENFTPIRHVFVDMDEHRMVSSTFHSISSRFSLNSMLSIFAKDTIDGSQASSLSSKLNWVDKRIISNERCVETFGPKIVISSTICGIGWENDGQNTCNGDSGKTLISVYVWHWFTFIAYFSLQVVHWSSMKVAFGRKSVSFRLCRIKAAVPVIQLVMCERHLF